MTDRIIEVVVDTAPRLIEVSHPGPKGDQGSQGEQGPSGVAQSYRFPQSTPSALWTVNHNLGRRPIVQLETIGGLVMIGGIIHVSDNIFQVSFDEPTTGVASYI
jgi:hypothetical protein